MPISIDEFESGEIPTDEQSVPLRVAVYLHEHADQAFTRSEIAGAIDADPNTVGTALSRLKQAELVRHRGTYWAITEDTERLRAAYDLHEATERYNTAEHEATEEEA
jgi:Mn-dependent DtxR family transcriptional regulator